VVGAGDMTAGSFVRKFVLATAVSLIGLAAAGGVSAKGMPADANTVALADLPLQARQTHELIVRGGPFPYDKDGTVFGNREKQLPSAARGFYREYTVKTPGARNRGARRIICGGRQPEKPQACYYTADHYTSFNRIVP
jgi:ribonuclease T1